MNKKIKKTPVYNIALTLWEPG